MTVTKSNKCQNIRCLLVQNAVDISSNKLFSFFRSRTWENYQQSMEIISGHPWNYDDVIQSTGKIAKSLLQIWCFNSTPQKTKYCDSPSAETVVNIRRKKNSTLPPPIAKYLPKSSSLLLQQHASTTCINNIGHQQHA